MIDLDGLSRKELAALNREIVQRIKQMDAYDVAKSMMVFRPGDRVSFESPQYGTVMATVMKLNRKTVSVIDEIGDSWNVSPQALKLVKEVLPQRPIIEGDSSSD